MVKKSLETKAVYIVTRYWVPVENVYLEYTWKGAGFALSEVQLRSTAPPVIESADSAFHEPPS